MFGMKFLESMEIVECFFRRESSNCFPKIAVFVKIASELGEIHFARNDNRGAPRLLTKLLLVSSGGSNENCIKKLIFF